MANKENLSPYAATWGNPAQNSSRLQLHATSGIRYQKQTPIPGLSPGKNPILSQQRDHSACRRTDSPLKVRKTRENLREPEPYIDVPPPCIHGAQTAVKGTNDATSEHVDTSGSTLVADFEDARPSMRPIEPEPAPRRITRHKSVSTRMLTKVKEGISHRSRSSQSVRAQVGSDAGLMRKLSGKVKQSSEEQPRMRSFEISRDSIDSLADGEHMQPESPPSYQSSEDPGTSIDDPVGSTSMTTPSPSSPLTPKSTTHIRQYSGQLLSPSPRPRTPSGDPTPRAKPASTGFGVDRDGMNLQVTIPFVDLSVVVDHSFIDVDISKNTWIAVEGCIRSRIVEAPSMAPAQTTSLRKRPIDAVIIVMQDVLSCDQKTTHKCIVELCSRLNIAGDRLAVLCARLQQTGTSAVNYECEQLHSLRKPSLTRLFERLGIAPSTVNTIFEENWQSLPDSLQYLSDAGLRKDRAQAFIISKTPDLLVQLVDHLAQWPAHAFKIGLASESATAPTLRTRHNWAIQIKGDFDDNVENYDNMIKDLRHGSPMGVISSLRMCYKPRQGCQILEILGQKALKDLRLGQCCSLFLKVQVPRIDTSRPNVQNESTETDSLFTELESIVGSLETNVVHVEARYRHSLLPTQSVVTVRKVCNIRRPKSDSRWSIVGKEDESKPERVHLALAQFLAMHYSPARALRMIDRSVMQQSSSSSDAIQQIRNLLEIQVNTAESLTSSSTSVSPDTEKPSVVITSIDSQEGHSMTAVSKVEIASPCIPSTSSLQSSTLQIEPSPLSPKSRTAAARAISVAKTTTAITTAETSLTGQSFDEGEDSARQLWRHIRHHSLSAKQLAEFTPSKLQQLEASDDSIKALRHRALSNKRSVGAETLRAWKWEEKASDGGGEAPWL